MPTSGSPIFSNEPDETSEELPEEVSPSPEPEGEGTGRQYASTSRWVDYDTHELLEMISELEDERRWARLREGIWIAILVHMLLLSAVTWIPRYIFKVPKVIDPFEAIQKHEKDLTYLNVPDALRQIQPRQRATPKLEKPPTIDRKTLEELRQQAPPPKPEEQPKVQTPKSPPPKPVIPPSETSKSPIQAPKPKPELPKFAMGSANPADQLQQAMRNAMRGRGSQAESSLPAAGGLSMHPGAGTGGVQVLSDTQGVDFSSWLARWHRETERTWDPLIPDEVNPPIMKSGAVVIRFKVLPNGRVMPGSMVLEGRSGDTGLDRAAWGAITGSNYPPLPRAFHGPYIELRAIFLYNMRPPSSSQY